MPYVPCQFSRDEYLEHAQLFEDLKIEDADAELCEFNDDTESLAVELAYTRYRVAKLEQEVQDLRNTTAGQVEPERREMKRILYNASGITSAAGLARELDNIVLLTDADPYLKGPGEKYAGIALELSFDTKDETYEIEIRPDP